MSELPELLGLLSSAKHLGGQQSTGQYYYGNNQQPASVNKPLSLAIDGKPVPATAGLTALISPQFGVTMIIVGGYISITDGRSFRVVIRDETRKKSYPLSASTVLGKPFDGGQLHIPKDLSLAIDHAGGAAQAFVEGYISYREVPE